MGGECAWGEGFQSGEMSQADCLTALLDYYGLKKEGKVALTPLDLLKYLPKVEPLAIGTVFELYAPGQPQWEGHWQLAGLKSEAVRRQIKPNRVSCKMEASSCATGHWQLAALESETVTMVGHWRKWPWIRRP